MSDADIIIIGTGIGGGTLAYALKDSGARVLLLERGDFLPQEEENWSIKKVIEEKRYQANEEWFDDATGKPFRPGTYYFVGGNSKMYGAAFPRFREQDFIATEHPEGLSPAWPISYEDLEFYYAKAEEIYMVHGNYAGTAPQGQITGFEARSAPVGQGLHPGLIREPPCLGQAVLTEEECGHVIRRGALQGPLPHRHYLKRARLG